jgi:hypothetical protein
VLLTTSIGVAILGAEAAARFALDPVDFLRPELVCDSRYGHRIRPGSGGHDAWGFRNPAGVGHADVLAVGDSQTYGESATARHSWPAWLGTLTGRSVYNAGVGGYGPVEYEKLVVELLPRVRPDVVLIGLYTGNDIWDASESCPNYQTNLAAVNSCDVPAELLCDRVMAASDEMNRLTWLRDWCSRHSVLYQAAKLATGRLTSTIRAEPVRRGEIVVSASGYAVGFDLAYWTRMTDIADARVRQGIEVAMLSIADMKRHCDDARTRCVFVLIPTKESVYVSLVSGGLSASDARELSRVVANEKFIRARLLAHLETIHAPFVDALPALRESARTSRHSLYPLHDPHPTGEGYRVIAAAIAPALGRP